jgi:hypothetical protein
VQIIDSRFSPAAHELRDFAARNLIPFHWVDVETDPEAETLRQVQEEPVRRGALALTATPAAVAAGAVLLAAGFGVVASRTGYPGAFALTGVLMLFALAPAWRHRAWLGPVQP